MSGYNFTDRVRKVLMLARENAGRLGHEYVSPDHLLLGIVSEGEGVAASAIVGLGVELPALGTEMEALMEPGEHANPGLDIPYTSRAKYVLEQAMIEARDWNHMYVGTEHLLLGVLREGQSRAAAVLLEHGLSVDRVRGEVLRMLHSATSPRPSANTWVGQPQAHRASALWASPRLALLVSVIALLVATAALVIAVKD